MTKQVKMNQWKPGATPYADYLAKLTPEQKQAHLQERAKKKAMKKAMDDVIKEQQEMWIAQLNNSAAKLLENAEKKGDVQAFIAVWDRIIGKPKEDIHLDTNKPLPFTDNFED